MKTYRVLGQKGRTTIPFSIRMRLGLRCGDVLSFAEENGTVIVRKEKICDRCKGKRILPEHSDTDSFSSFTEQLTTDERRALLTCLIAKFSEELGTTHTH